MSDRSLNDRIAGALRQWGLPTDAVPAAVTCAASAVVIVDGPVAIVVLDRPPVNALSVETYVELAEVFRSLSVRDELSAVILSAAGDRAFCAGADINERATLGSDEAARRRREAAVASFYRELATLPMPVIAAVGGACIGSGAVAVSLADIRVATTAAWFALPEIDIRACGGGRHLMRVLPRGIVGELALTGRRMTADEAHRLGFVNCLTEPVDLAIRVREYAVSLSKKHRPTLVATKNALRLVEEMSLRDGFEFEQDTTFRLGMLDTENAQ